MARGETQVEDRIRDILLRFLNQRFNGIAIAGVERQYDVGDGRRADIVVLKDDGNPILIIETKRKVERPGSFRVERRFMVTSPEVVGQAMAYAALLYRRGVHVPFIAAANDRQIAVFLVPKDLDRYVNWDAVKERAYGRVIRDFYGYKHGHALLHEAHKFSEQYFHELLDKLTGIYVRRYGFEERRQPLHWILIEDIRGFVDFLTPYVLDAIAPHGELKPDIAEIVEKHATRTGYRPTPENLAREMAYVLLNKIVFYKVLERFYNLPRLGPLYEEGRARTVNEYLRHLKCLFDEAVKATGDFETIFHTGIYDLIEFVENEGILRALDYIVRLMEYYEIEKFSDIIGYVYEDLIPGEERHQLGQFYTPKPIAELIVKWAVRSPDDRVLDPGCGSGTFLVEAYKRLAELKLKRSFHELKYVPRDVHKQILDQLYGADINEFPAHLTTMNLAMRNPKAPSTNTNVFPEDYFTITPGKKLLAPYKTKTPKGEKQVEVVFKDFDAVVGNPPYTRWGEIPEPTQREIINRIGDVLRSYDLLPIAGRRGAEYTMVVFWIAHSMNFLKEGGRLGMIVSDTWLQATYGIRFFRLLCDHFKIHAIIDISARVFPVPLTGSCIIFLEKCGRNEDRESNKIALAYLNVKKGGIDVEELLKIVESKNNISLSTEDYDIVIRVYDQRLIRNVEEPIITLIFNVDDILRKLRESSYIVELGQYFEPTYGNMLYTVLYTRRVVRTRHAGVGGEEFFYLTEERARQHRIPTEFLYPLLPSSRNARFFTFTKDDWDELRKAGGECFLFLCHRSRNQLPREVQDYIRLGETEIRLSKGIHRGEPVSRSRAAEARRGLRQFFVDWYDLGGVIEAPISVSRGARYRIRFILSRFNVALDDRILALIPRQDVSFSEVELKALLAYLNSSFSQLQAEVRGRTAGGVALLELDVRPLSEFLIPDVRRLSREDVERLASLFDKLESEARGLGGADTAESIYGSDLAKELTGRDDVRRGVRGLFNIVIREIDYEVGRILGLGEGVVEAVRTMVVDLARRRLSRVREARTEAIRGSEEQAVRRPRRTRRSSGGVTRRLDEFMGRP